MDTVESGLSLPEVLVGLFLAMLAALAAVPLFISAMHSNAASRDLSWVGVAAERRLELLRQQPYAALAPGGSLTADVTGYFAATIPDVKVRWRIADNSAVIPRTKIITLRAFRTRPGYGPAGNVTTVTLRGD